MKPFVLVMTSYDAKRHHVPLKRSPSAVATSSRNVQYSFASTGACTFVSGHPFFTIAGTACSAGSVFVSFWNSS